MFEDHEAAWKLYADALVVPDGLDEDWTSLVPFVVVGLRIMPDFSQELHGMILCLTSRG